MNNATWSKRQTLAAGCAAILVAAASLAIATGCEQRPADPAGGAAHAPPAAHVYEFDIDGMHCAGCVYAVRTAISKLDGVATCEVSLEEKRATVSMHDPAIVASILEAVEKLNFEVRQRNAGEPEGDRG